MKVRTSTPAARLRAGRQDGGFTLIELIVVVGILGVLAAIATPAYLGITAAARDGAVRFDLANDKTAITAWSIDNNGAIPPVVGFNPTALGLKAYGWSDSAESATDRYAVSTLGTSPRWCLEITGTTGNTYRVSTNTGVAPSTCADLGGANY